MLVKLQSGEAAVLIIRRSETEPPKYFFAVRKSGSSFDGTTKDFQLHGLQKTLLELGDNLEFSIAMEKAIASIREVQP
jgi:hypothetical protein